MSLLSSKNESQRRDALSSLVNTLTSEADGHVLRTAHPAIKILTKARPLLVDASKTIRASALELLRLLPVKEVERHVQLIQVYVHIGLTHMVSEIRMSTLDVLDWLLLTVGDALVSCPGGWTGTVNRLIGVLGWQTSASSSSQAGNAPASQRGWSNLARTKLDDTKLRARQIATLANLLNTGLQSPNTEDSKLACQTQAARTFPLWDLQAHVMAQPTNPYGHLSLFAETEGLIDDEGTILADAVGRGDHTRAVCLEGIRKGVIDAKKEGGEIGRAARSVESAIKLCVANE